MMDGNDVGAFAGPRHPFVDMCGRSTGGVQLQPSGAAFTRPRALSDALDAHARQMRHHARAAKARDVLGDSMSPPTAMVQCSCGQGLQPDAAAGLEEGERILR